MKRHLKTQANNHGLKVKTNVRTGGIRIYLN